MIISFLPCYSIEHDEVVLQKGYTNSYIKSIGSFSQALIQLIMAGYMKWLLDDCITVSIQVATWLVIIVKLD